MKPVILVLTEKRTGSTVLANALYGLICPNEIIQSHTIVRSFDSGRAGTLRQVKALYDTCGVIIIKSHIHSLKTGLEEFNDVAERNGFKLYIVTVSRGDIKTDTGSHDVLEFQYEDIETDNNSVEQVIDHVYSHLKGFIPDSIKLNKETGVQRLNEMNTSIEALKNMTYHVIDRKHRVFGAHWDRDREGSGWPKGK